MTRKEQLDELEKLLGRLRAANLGSPVLVEGDRDAVALHLLGLEGEVLKINQGLSLVERSDELSHKYRKVILLTDWDDKGVQLHARLRGLLEDVQVESDDFFWNRLKRLVGGGSRTVEDLPAFIRILKERSGSEG